MTANKTPQIPPVTQEFYTLEQTKAETEKFQAEAIKLKAEAKKFDRDKWWLPITLILPVVVTIITYFIKRSME